MLPAMQPLAALALATAAPVGKFLSMRPLIATTSIISPALAHAAKNAHVGVNMGAHRTLVSAMRSPSTFTTAFMIPPRHYSHDFDLCRKYHAASSIGGNKYFPSVLPAFLPALQHDNYEVSHSLTKTQLGMGRMMTTTSSGSYNNNNNNDSNGEEKGKDVNNTIDNNNGKNETKIITYTRKPKSSSTKSFPTISPLYHGEPLQKPAGLLFRYDSILQIGDDDDSSYGAGVVVNDDDGLVDDLDNLLPKAGDNLTEVVRPPESEYFFIPQVKLHDGDGSGRKRVLVLCTGGTLTMAPNPEKGGALSPVPGALTDFMKSMLELTNDKMPDVVVHEYTPLLDSSDMGPPDWALLANDIKANYLYFDGFVILMGTDTMAYTATALSFMLENLGKPVVFTGSQVPIAEPHSDARQNLIMALIFASRDVPICEVTIFFHDRLIRACRSSKVNAGEMHAFDSPNLAPLATVGISIKENEHLILPQARGALRVHTKMDTRILALRLVPGFDDTILRYMIKAGAESGSLRALVLQLYGTGNAPMVKDDLIECLREARELGILVIASTQCHRGSVMMGHYATGQALERVGVVSSNDMTLEAISCKVAYLLGRGDLSIEEIGNLMTVSMRGEVTHTDALPPPPFTSAYQRASRKGRYFF